MRGKQGKRKGIYGAARAQILAALADGQVRTAPEVAARCPGLTFEQVQAHLGARNGVVNLGDRFSARYQLKP